MNIENLKNQLREKTFIDSNNILNPDFQNIDLDGFEVFTKKNNLLESEIFGVELKYIGIIAFIIWILKNKF